MENARRIRKILPLLLTAAIISLQVNSVAYHEAEPKTGFALQAVVLQKAEPETASVEIQEDSGESVTPSPSEADNGESVTSSPSEADSGGNVAPSLSAESGGESVTPEPSDKTGETDTPEDNSDKPTVAAIPATDIDVGDITSITLGTSQILSVTLIPVNSTDTLSYTSLTPEIASVNGLGRVRGLAAGEAQIRIDAGSVSKVITVSIIQEKTEEEDKPIPATAIDVSYEETMSVDTSQILTVSLLPSNSDSSVRYSSNNPSVADVNEFGRVNAYKAGTVRITISAGDARETVEITVKDDKEVKEMDFGDVPEEMTVGASQTLSVNILPAEAADQPVTYYSSDSEILEVNPFGRVVARKAGKATITARSGQARCSVSITVKPELKVEKMDFGDVPNEMTTGTSQVLSVSILPAEAANQTVTYRSSSPEILEVNPFGRVTAKNIGTATITAQSGDVTCSAVITVKPEIRVEKMDFGDVQTELTAGTSQNLNVSILPAEASSRTVTYDSSEPDILEVNSFGRIIAKNPGTAVITANADDVSCSVTITVKERVKVSEIEFNDAQTEMILGTSQTLNVAILPNEAAEKTITYSSSNSDILTVNSFGRVNAVNLGEAVITARAEAVSKSISITVKAKIKPNDIDFEKPDSELLLGSSVNLGASVLPTNAENQTITYTSSDPSVLTVNAAGKITGRSLGTATVSMEAGNVQKSVTISVVEEIKVNTIEVSEFNKKMKVDATQTLSTSVFPTDAKDQKIAFSSSNPAVASISEGGVVTAKAAGKTVLTLKAGRAVKELDLTVYVATEEIQVPESYLILHPSVRHQISARVKPGGADQNVSYRSTDAKVATVSKDGWITALSTGRTSIVLENDDAMATVTVIVNEESAAPEPKPTPEPESDDHEESELAMAIREANQEIITESGSRYSFITNDALLALQQTGKQLKVTYDSYNMTIKGNRILNVNNEFSTDIGLKKTSDIIPDAISFTVSEDHNLPGSLEIEFLDLAPDYRYLYLYNIATKEYERLNMQEAQKAEIGMSGKYLLTTKKIRKNRWPIYGTIVAGGIVVAGIGVYIATKKKYWFW